MQLSNEFLETTVIVFEFLHESNGDITLENSLIANISVHWHSLR